MDQIHECKNCGKKYKARLSTQKFCSKKCREAHWIVNNRERSNASSRRYRAKRYAEEGQWYDNGVKARALKAWMIELKQKPCTDCGGRFEVCCMDFDHRKETEKTYNVGSMFAHHYSRELIETELTKCDLVCSNCHRIRTRNRRLGSGKHRTIPPVSEDT